MKQSSEIKILVVEDDSYFQRVLQKRLASEGYQVMTASDGREGMKAIVAWEPDLVISDWMMPHVDGLELCQSVKTGLKETAPYFILLTAKGEISDRLLALDTGADDYLIKPCDQGELMARVRAGLRSVVLAQELREVLGQLRAAHAQLAAARAEAGGLNGKMPACLMCRKILTPEGGWRDLHEYLGQRGVIDLGLAVCPACESSAGDPPREADSAA